MYLDSAIIVKLLVVEPDTKLLVQGLIGEPLSSSELATVEVISALFRKERERVITAAERVVAWEEFQRRVGAGEIVLHPFNPALLNRARHILDRCHPAVPLRSLDAIHTATCDLSQDFPLCTTDKRMRDAAGVLGIPIFPADESPNP